MSDHGSDSVFSDVEEAAAPRLSEKDPGSVSSHSVTPSGDNVVTPAGSDSDIAITPLRPLSSATMKFGKKRKALPLASDSSSGEDTDDATTEPLTDREGMTEIKGLLRQLFKKVEQNSRTLTELQTMHLSRFVANTLQ